MSHTLAQDCHCESCCGMHLTCKNTPITPDRNGPAKRHEKVSRSYHRQSQRCCHSHCVETMRLRKPCRKHRGFESTMDMAVLGLAAGHTKNDAGTSVLAWHWYHIHLAGSLLDEAHQRDPIPLQSRKETALELSKRNLMLEVLHLFRWFAHTYTHIHNFVTHTISHIILSHTEFSHTTLSHTQFFHTNPFTHIHTHAQICPTQLFRTRLCHSQLFHAICLPPFPFFFPVVIGCLTFLSVFYSFSSTIPQLSPIGGWSLAANE